VNVAAGSCKKSNLSRKGETIMFIIASVFCSVSVATLMVQYLSYRQYIATANNFREIKLQAKEGVCAC
jgi:hypothetical protein